MEQEEQQEGCERQAGPEEVTPAHPVPQQAQRRLQPQERGLGAPAGRRNAICIVAFSQSHSYKMNVIRVMLENLVACMFFCFFNSNVIS